MKALILAAGEGKRMGPLTENRPKPMLPVAGRPFLEHTISALKSAGVDDVTILTGYRGMFIKEHFGDGKDLGVNIKYIVQPKRLGTAHAIKMAKGYMNEPFLCLNGDVIVNRRLILNLIERYTAEGITLMTLAEVEDASRFGLVKLKGDSVKGIVEKSGEARKGAINGGIYLFKTNIFDYIEKTPLSPRGEYEITRSLELLMKKESVLAVFPEDPWIDIGLSLIHI